MRTALNQITAVRPGLAFREGIRHEPGGRVVVVQAGDVDPNRPLDPGSLLRLKELPGQAESQFLAAGDVLLQCRGLSYKAAAVPTLAEKTIATASVLVLTPTPAVRPAYLALLLNDQATQAELRKLATGATIANLKKSAVEQLEVLVPSLEDQDKIVVLADCQNQISRLEARLTELRHIELRALIELRAGRNRKRANASGS